MGLSTAGFKEALVGRLLQALDSREALNDSSSTELVLGDKHIELPTLPEGGEYVAGWW